MQEFRKNKYVFIMIRLSKVQKWFICSFLNILFAVHNFLLKDFIDINLNNLLRQIWYVLSFLNSTNNGRKLSQRKSKCFCLCFLNSKNSNQGFRIKQNVTRFSCVQREKIRITGIGLITIYLINTNLSLLTGQNGY